MFAYWNTYEMDTWGYYNISGSSAKTEMESKRNKMCFSFRGFDAFDDFCWDDKKAILGEFSYYFEKLIKNGKLNP